MAGEQGEVRTGSKTGFQLRRLPVQSERGQRQTHTRALTDFDRQNSVNSVQSGLSGLAVHVPHRAPNSNIKASPPRSTSYETHIVAHQQGRGDEVGLPVCPAVENPVLVHQETLRACHIAS